jgi:hypothetical protein
MDIAWELLHDPTVLAIIGWIGALGIVILWVWIARTMIHWRVRQVQREQAEKAARARDADAHETPKG